MPFQSPPRQADPLQRWLRTGSARELLLEAQGQWIEPGGSPPGGQVLLRSAPLQDWPHPPAPAAFTMACDLHCEQGHWWGPWHCRTEQWPLPTTAISRIELRFVLEDEPRPEQVLAECARVLCSDGRLLILGLNPLGAARLRWARHDVKARSCDQIAVWLREQGLVVDRRQALGPYWRPSATPAPGKTLMPRWLDAGRVAWGLLAVKRQWPLTPLRSPARWQRVQGVPAA